MVTIATQTELCQCTLQLLENRHYSYIVRILQLGRKRKKKIIRMRKARKARNAAQSSCHKRPLLQTDDTVKDNALNSLESLLMGMLLKTSERVPIKRASHSKETECSPLK